MKYTENLQDLEVVPKKIVLFGGSFNPPHIPHRRILEELVKLKRFDWIFIIPCGTRMDKVSTNIIPKKHRVEMVKIAFKDLPKVTFDFYDLENDIFTPTYLLQERYKKLFPDAEIWHLVGEDIIAGGCNGKSEIHQIWDQGPRIWQDLNFLVVVRPGYGARYEDFPPHAEIIEIGYIIGSGTLIRKYTENNRSIDGLVEPEIKEYIKKNKLYK